MGLQTSEMIGLAWSCVSFEKREITIEKTLEYRYSVGQWVLESPKTKHGYRPLTVDTYVHGTQDSIEVATEKFSSYLDELLD